MLQYDNQKHRSPVKDGRLSHNYDGVGGWEEDKFSSHDEYRQCLMSIIASSCIQMNHRLKTFFGHSSLSHYNLTY